MEIIKKGERQKTFAGNWVTDMFESKMKSIIINSTVTEGYEELLSPTKDNFYGNLKIILKWDHMITVYDFDNYPPGPGGGKGDKMWTPQQQKYLDNMKSEIIAYVDQRVDRLEDKVDKLEEKVDKLEAKVDKLEAKVDKLEAKVDKLENKVDELETKVDELNENVKELTGLIKELLSNKQSDK